MGLPQEAILNYFIFDLSHDIINETTIYRFVSISQAFGIVKLIEAKLKDVKSKFQKLFFTSFNYIHPNLQNNPLQNPKT